MVVWLEKYSPSPLPAVVMERTIIRLTTDAWSEKKDNN